MNGANNGRHPTDFLLLAIAAFLIVDAFAGWLK